MFEKYLIQEEGFYNVKQKGKTVGFEIALRIPYYRGIPMSCVQEICLKIDDSEVSREDMIIKVKGECFTYTELETAVNHRWEMTESITVFVKKDGGLAEGNHKVYGLVSLRISYQPHPNIGEDEKILLLGAEQVKEEY